MSFHAMGRHAAKAALLLATCHAACFSQTIPAVKGKTLEGQAISLPEPGNRKPILLMLGFSHKSSEDFKLWNKSFKQPYVSDSSINYFEVVELQGVPSFVNGMILHGMRREVPKAEQSHFVTIYNSEEAWKQLVHFGPAEVAYLVLTDEGGKVVWQTHGPATPQKSSELAAALVKLRSGSSSGGSH